MMTWVCLGLGSFGDLTRSNCPLMPRCTTSVSPLSNVRSRYFPSRPTDLMEWPSRRARKCLAEACRRTERPLDTPTALIFRPTTSRDRSWRSVSTSGSSGTGKAFPGRSCGLLFGVLLGASLAGTPPGPADEDLGYVDPVVVGPRPHHRVTGRPRAVAHGFLLQPALVVKVVGFLAGPLNCLAELAQDELPRGLPAGVEIDRSEDGLEGVGQDGGLGPATRPFFAPAQQEDLTYPEPTRHLRQDAGVNHGGTDLGQLAFGEVGEALERVAGHDEAQNGVAQELEALVGGRASLLLAAPAPVGEGVLKEAQVGEGMAKSLGQCGRPLSAGVTPPRAWRRRSQLRPGPCAGPRGPRH